MLFLDDVYVDGVNGSPPRNFARSRRRPTTNSPNLPHTIAQRVACFLERQGLLERDGEHSYLASEPAQEGPMDQLLSHSILTSKRAGNAAAPST
jgi:hypothetical protein